MTAVTTTLHMRESYTRRFLYLLLWDMHWWHVWQVLNATQTEGTTESWQHLLPHTRVCYAFHTRVWQISLSFLWQRNVCGKVSGQFHLKVTTRGNISCHIYGKLSHSTNGSISCYISLKYDDVPRVATLFCHIYKAYPRVATFLATVPHPQGPDTRVWLSAWPDRIKTDENRR